MKLQSLLIMGAVLVSTFCNGQLKVFDTGNISMGTTSSSDYRTYIYSEEAAAHRALVVNQFTSSSSTEKKYGIVSSIPSGAGGNQLFGILGTAYRGSTPTSALSFGVNGVSGNGLSGYNYGIYGVLIGDRNGAAVFGTTSTTYNTGGKYAGFFKGDVNIIGNLNVTGSYSGSDLNLKKDVRDMDDNVIDKLGQLRSIRYKLKLPSELDHWKGSLDSINTSDPLEMARYEKDNIGLIAQELQEVFPEVVLEGQDGYLGVNYDQIIPILVKAINIQQEQINKLESKLETEFSKKSLSMIQDETSEYLEQSFLYQNSPNPFNQNTAIKYFIPELQSNAMINIYDLRGKQLKSFQIAQPGDGEINITASMFDPGIYVYNLIINGRVIDTKQMILIG